MYLENKTSAITIAGEIMYSEEEKLKLIEKFKQSGKRSTQFSREHNICKTTFSDWLKKYNKRDNESFVEVKIPKTIQGSYVIIKRNGFEIQVDETTSIQSLTTVLKALSAL